jgi:hypothetical protein
MRVEILSVLFLSAAFCLWLAGMLRAGSAPDPWPVQPDQGSTPEPAHGSSFHGRTRFSSRDRRAKDDASRSREAVSRR